MFIKNGSRSGCVLYWIKWSYSFYNDVHHSICVIIMLSDTTSFILYYKFKIGH